MASSSSSSSSSVRVLSSQSWNYDVFLSFRGADTRKTFVDHLYSALDQNGIYTYKDDVTLARGELINPALLKAIEESQIALIIFSKNYANSKWCLIELTHIMKRMEEGKLTVIPIFYDVKPTIVEKQEGEYRVAFKKYKHDNKAEVESWRKALVEATNISGREIRLTANGHEAQGIEIIVEEISQRLVASRADENMVGMRTRVQRLKSKLQMEAGGVRMIGVWGVGGGGKSTLASFIYDDISNMFDRCCFVNNIREESSKNGLEKLQEKLLSGILKTHVQEVSRVEEGRSRIMARLGHQKVLIVLDDVDKLDQLQELVGSRDWFGQGSRIIITTRDEHLLKAHGVDVIQPISMFNNDEAIKLFCKYAHRDLKPPKDFEKLSKEVVSYACGLPLALKWKSALKKLKDIPHKDIIGILRISFDGLEQDEKDMFLDIACFFYMWETKDRAMEVFDACGFHPGIGVEVLRQKALIVIDEDGEFDMHDVVQEMGQYIVREKHPRNPEKHSRVWKEEDVQRILHMAATTELDNIEAIDQRGLSYKDTQRFLQVAGNMTKLRWIHLNFNYWSDDAKRDENIVPLPSNFPPPQLCYLHVSACIRQKQLWEGYKYLPNLTHVELICLSNLIKIPDFSGFPKLEKFEVHYCLCLEEIHPGIRSLESLVLISITKCPRLRNFQSITRIKKLETLVLSDICLGDKERYDLWELPNLEKLDLSHNSSFTGLDFSILRLPRLKWLDVSRCKCLVELSQLPSSIAVVDANGCDSFKRFGDIINCKWLWNVSLDECNILDQENGDTLIHSMLQGNALEDHYISVALYEHRLPNGLIGRLFGGNTFRVHLPDDWYTDFCGFLICIVTKKWKPVIKITIKQEGPPFDLSHESDEVVEPTYIGETTHVGYVPFSSLSHTTLLTLSYDIISVTIEIRSSWVSDEGPYGGIKLVPRRSKSDEVQTTYYSEFWDQKLQDAGKHPFAIQQGVDTRKTFVDHLYKALDQQGIYTYKDDVTLERGDSINPALLKAIEESQIAVIIFSKNYANSKWCLDELTHIMKRNEEGKQTVMPIFYDVEPTEVRYQKRTYEDAFAKHELANKEKVESWRKSLVDASNLSGWETKLIANGHEAQGIKIIVDEISQRLVTSRENEDLV
ncbi:hypothetical protein LXL04_005899 [Taraxacum kok-saghyz]